MKTLPIIMKIEDVRDDFSNSKERCFKKFNDKNDVRVTVFSKIINVLNSAQLGLTFIGQSLLQDNWWNITAKEHIPNDDKNSYINEVDMFLKLGLVQFSFSSVESSFRVLIRSLDPKMCSNGTGNFESIYKSLFKKINLSNKEEYVSLMDLLKLIRNSLHNNGVYFPQNNKNCFIKYKGKSYEFIIGEAIDFADWLFLIKLIEDVREMLDEVMKCPNIISIDKAIDPFSD